MALDHKQAATEVLAAVGGKGNIVSAAHCATRLRLVVADDSKVDEKKVENCAGVKGCFKAAGQIQIIYGTGTVNKVYDEFVAQAGVAASSKDDAKAAAAAKGNWFQRAIKALGDVFVPIIPAIVASGLLMGLCSGLSAAFPGLATSGEFQLVSLFSNASFVFLQILIGFSAAKVFGGNPYLGAVIGMIMVHSGLVNAWNIPTITAKLGDQAYQLVTATNTASAITTAGGIPMVSILGGAYNVPLVGYQGHVIPVVIAVWFMSKLEIKLHKVVPDIIDLFVTPLTTVLVTGFLTLTIFGPFFGWIENGVLAGVKYLIAVPMGIGAFFCGLVYAPTVVMGIHHMYNALEAGMLAGANPMDTWMPIATAANVAQGAACLAVALKTKQTKMKELALPASLSAFLGITEPAIFGVNLRFMKPFVAGMIGAAFGAAVASILGVYSTAMGITGLFGFLDTTNCTFQYTLVMLVAFAIAFAISFTIYKDEEPEGEADGASNLPEGAAIAKPQTICSPMTGKAVKMSEVPDPTFAKEMMGGGVAIQPTDGHVVSPADGTVTMLFDTKHAVGITTTDGAEVLIHIGLDTVKMEGKPFTAHVKQGDTVKKGQALIDVDLDAIKKAGYNTITPIVITNSDSFGGIEPVTGKSVKAGEPVITLK
jgi:PTS system sucrose-specific IIC component